MNGKDIIRINSDLKGARSLWDALWEDVANYIVFRKASISGKLVSGSKLTSNMYDATATMCAEDLAAWIHSNMTMMAMEWFGLTSGERDNETDKVLEECTRVQFEAFRQSNFETEWLEVLSDLTSFCTGALFVEELEVKSPGFNGFNFISLAPGSYTFLEDRDGRACGVFRELELKANEAVDRWGDKVSDKIKKDTEKNPSNLHSFIHAVFPSRWFGSHETRLEYVSYYVEVSNKNVLSTGGFDFFPFIVIPWRRESGESWGRGPGITALPEVKTLNKAKELGLKEWALSIWPPMTGVENGIVGSVRMTPGGLTIIKKQDALKPFDTGAKHQDNRIKEEDLKQSIREIFHNDKVKYIQPRDETGQMTAYEVSRRYQLAQQLLGPTFGNIVYYGLDPLIETTFKMMNAAGAFGILPEGLRAAKIEYKSPLARAQRGQDIDAIRVTMEAVQGIMSVKPDVTDNFDLDGTAVHIAKSAGYPAKLINSAEVRKGVRDKRQKEIEQQRQAELAATMAKAAKDGAGAMKELPEGMKG